MTSRATAARAISLGALLIAAHTVGAQSSAAVLRERVRAYRVAHEGAIVREFGALLALPNVYGDQAGIRRNAAALVAMLEKRGVRARLLEIGEGSPAVYGELPALSATHTVALYAHYDGQPLDPAQWSTPPWTPTLRERSAADGGAVIPFPATDDALVSGEARIYARSASDDKASIIAMLAGLDALRAAGQQPTVNLKFFFEGEEEAGSPHLGQILEKFRDVLAADAWLFCDGPVHQNGRKLVSFGARGVASLELTVYGASRPLHSGHYGNWAPNPGAMIATLIAGMRDDDGHITIANFYDDVRAVAPAEHAAVAALPTIDDELRRSLALGRTEANGALLGERIMLPALNVRGIQVGAVGERAANAIASEARASFDFRLVPNQTPARVRELVETHLRTRGYFVTSDSVTVAMRLAHPKVVRAEWGSGYPASRVSLELPFARALVRAVGDGTDQPPLAMPTVGASGPMYLFEQILKVPMLSLPIANYDNNQHAANENLRIKNLWDGVEMYAALMSRLGGYWSGRMVP
ncbi:MAG: M20/M25/M40 family metallo-hydrolase [Gemmatimonadaceae bacterium]